MSYAVVKNERLEFYVVPKKWLTKVDDDPKQYTLYPTTKMKKCVESMKDAQGDWPMEEIEIVHNDIADLKLANEFVDMKCLYANSEASEMDKKKDKTQKKSRKISKNEVNFNSMYEKESGHKQKQIKLESAFENQVVPESQNIGFSIIEDSLENRFSCNALQDNIANATLLPQNSSLASTSQFRPNSPIFNKHSSDNLSSMSDHYQESYLKTPRNIAVRQNDQEYDATTSFNGTGGSMMFIRRSTVEQILQENVILRKNQENMMTIINTMAINDRNAHY
ncbi:unnamed protein product [Chironomus riparius]|uniref:Uncharacterized protein n=1 Tax=Chironomus riparius TaxID=315576 RepID=A0A9N9S739_9DIPT|nr:unnamed protein product [Chironomus riparius]